MIARTLRAATLAACATLGLSACTTFDDDYGYGYGRPSYSVGLGYGSGWYDDPYWGPGYGWYDGFYYPGSGYYVFDRAGRRHAWNDRQRQHWQNRGSGAGPRRPDWEGNRANITPEQRQAWQARRDAWRAQRQQQGTTGDAGFAARREAWRAQRQQNATTATPAPQARRSFGGSGRPAWHGGGRRGRN